MENQVDLRGFEHRLKCIALSIQNLYCGFGCCRLDTVEH